MGAELGAALIQDKYGQTKPVRAGLYAGLPPLVPDGPRRRMLIEVSVSVIKHYYRPIYDNNRMPNKPPDKVQPNCACGWEGQWWPTARQAASSYLGHLRRRRMEAGKSGDCLLDAS